LVFVINNFRGLVVDSAHESSSSVHVFISLIEVLFIHFPGVAEINDLDVEVSVHHYVLGFQISMHDVLLHNVLVEVNQLRKKVLDHDGSDSPSRILDQVVKGSIWSDLKYEVEIRSVLKRIHKLD